MATHGKRGGPGGGWEKLAGLFAGQGGDEGQVVQAQPGEVDYRDSSFDANDPSNSLRFKPERRGMFGIGANDKDADLARKLNLEQTLTGQKIKETQAGEEFRTNLGQQTKIADEERAIHNASRVAFASLTHRNPEEFPEEFNKFKTVYGPQILQELIGSSKAKESVDTLTRLGADQNSEMLRRTNSNVLDTSSAKSTLGLRQANSDLENFDLKNRAERTRLITDPISREQQVYKDQFTPFQPSVSYDYRPYTGGTNKTIDIAPKMNPMESDFLKKAGMPVPTNKVGPSLVPPTGTVIGTRPNGQPLFKEDSASVNESPVDRLLTKFGVGTSEGSLMTRPPFSPSKVSVSPMPSYTQPTDTNSYAFPIPGENRTSTPLAEGPLTSPTNTAVLPQAWGAFKDANRQIGQEAFDTLLTRPYEKYGMPVENYMQNTVNPFYRNLYRKFIDSNAGQ